MHIEHSCIALFRHLRQRMHQNSNLRLTFVDCNFMHCFRCYRFRSIRRILRIPNTGLHQLQLSSGIMGKDFASWVVSDVVSKDVEE